MQIYGKASTRITPPEEQEEDLKRVVGDYSWGPLPQISIALLVTSISIDIRTDIEILCTSRIIASSKWIDYCVQSS